jgi:adenine-specific DNA-methyltransferase
MPTLHWIGKDKVINHHMSVPFKILEHSYGYDNGEQTNHETQSGNRIIHGDNLEALKALLPEYEGRVKCIYIDPPYNTGNESWVYNDNVNDPKINKWLGEVVGKEAEDLTRHDKWLCMMYPRLKLLQKLLSEDGAIFISIDDNEQANLRLICDEIFGGTNFVANVIWQKKYSPQNDAKHLSTMHDFIVIYAKNKTIWRPNLLSRSDESLARYKNPDNDPRGNWKVGDLTSKTKAAGHSYPITSPTGKVFYPSSGRQWAASYTTFERLLAENRIWFGKNGENVPSLKQFLNEVQAGTVPLTIWMRDEVGDNQEAVQILKGIFGGIASKFETPKPPRLIERILHLATDKDSIVLDSYCGSGTTAHAVLNQNKKDGGNRKFIMVEMEDYAETITAERVKRVIKGYSDKESIKGGFDYFVLGKELFLESGNLNEQIEVGKIRSYIWYTETKTAYNFNSKSTNKYYLGTKDDNTYYFFYEPDELTSLDHGFLATIKTKAEQYVIYADNCLLTSDYMVKHHIIFKKIPRDITRF